MSASLTFLERFDQRPRIKRLGNGMTIVHIPMPKDPRFYLGVTIAAGARYEAAEANGAAHFLEHMMFRGSRRYPTFKKLSRAFEWLGGEWNAATGYEHTEYWFSGNRLSWAKAIDLFADFFCYPMLNDLEIERDVIRRELQKEMNEYGLNTDLDFQTFAQIWPHSSLSRPILGSPEHIKRMTKKAIREYRHKHYLPSRMVVCAVGGEEDEPILDKLNQAFGHYRPRTRARPSKPGKLPIFRGPASKWLDHSDNEYHIQMSFLCGAEWGPQALDAGLLSRILADGYFSRLGERLRETLGLVYSIDAQPNLFSDHGTLDITASVGASELPRFMTELLRILQKLKHEGLSQREVRIAKARALMDVELVPTDPENLGFRWSWSLLSGKRPSLANMAKGIQAVSKERLQRRARTLFQPKNASLVVLGPKDDKLQATIDAMFLNFKF
jgi:predicted Zn-dependent peptidase